MGNWDHWRRQQGLSNNPLLRIGLLRNVATFCSVALVGFLLGRNSCLTRFESVLPVAAGENVATGSLPIPSAPLSGVVETERIANLIELDDGKRAEILRSALKSLGSTPMSRDVALALASCVPRDVADALLPQKDPADHVQPLIVVDVGANGGYPVTKLGLQRSYNYVVSIEPDSRNVDRLVKYIIPQGTTYMPIKAAAARSPGQQEMAFHKERDDFTCFTCLDTSGRKPEVYTQMVNVTTLDLAVHENDRIQSDALVQLLKIDVQGYEVEVLHGAVELLGSGRVQYSLVEFDPRLLGREETALELLSIFIEKAGMACFHLRFSGRSEESVSAEPIPLFEYSPIPAERTREFLSFVKAQGGWTDLFCRAKGASL